uniref:Calmodulin-lysine N-methyltransferase n=1 Tax=Ditylum brightwellii TaxID=49249 RepID=A0A7S2EAV5_9STRA|mmetsp:Transcript_22326/g.33276  ORF Transcript_22326/g.33276 Transcript_22326/m.33276 type:complete len:403 (+) Transcript_22326:100-1308(+)
MQNRFTIRPVPTSFITNNTPNNNNDDNNKASILKLLQEYMEDHLSTWIDRIAFLPSSPQTNGAVVAIELSLESYTHKACYIFDNHTVSLSDNDDERRVEFTIRKAKPITQEESDQLLFACPDNGKEMTLMASNHYPSVDKDTMQKSKQFQIHIPSTSNGCEGGTGSKPWRGGILLAQAIERILPTKIFEHKNVLELGAGSFGLPSIMLGLIAMEQQQQQTNIQVTVSDLVDEVVAKLHEMVQTNKLQNIVSVQQIDFYNLNKNKKYNVIMYADCVYSVEQGQALASACHHLLEEKGIVYSMLPPFRVGISEHVNTMTTYFGEAEVIDLTSLLPSNKHKKRKQQHSNYARNAAENDTTTTKTAIEEVLKSQNMSRMDGIQNACVEGGNGNGYQLLKWTYDVKI